ncbi:MAG: YraN family protein [Puniceicoccales bacterium]|jgi:putative endonuclease|nr:YraN family protein [Puniceicoccales bacterium]
MRIGLFGNILKKFETLGRVIGRIFSRKRTANACLGKLGEDLAVDFLRRKHFKILRRNWTFGKGEIDIVALDMSCDVLVFVEVKLRAKGALIPGYFAVNTKKKNILRRTCRAYLRNFAAADIPHRFDVIAVEMCESGSPEIFHYENVKLF